MSTTPSARPTRCSLAALERGDVPVGTAVPARYWMLVGHPGPWPAKPIAAPDIADVRADLDAALGRFGARLQLIRRHGRLEGDQVEAEGLQQVFLVDVRRGLVGRARWERPEDLVALAGRFDDLPDPTSEPLFLVCAHGRKDVCCAVEGRVVAAVLDDALPGAVWETTHLGGDRFALSGPATITLRDDGAVIDGLAISSGSASLTSRPPAGRRECRQRASGARHRRNRSYARPYSGG